jgi:hypothetical protein
MATQSPPPDAAAPEQAPEPPAPSTAGVYEYVDLTPHTYLFPGSGPQTAEFGDVCPLPYDPEDGRWQPSKKKVTRLPDNHPDQIAANQKAAAKAAEQDAAASGKA